MPLEPGSYVFGPDSGTLKVRTKKAGKAAKVGHDLEMEVTRWSATLEMADKPALAVSADPRSFRVLQGTGGVKPLSDEEKEAIPQTIDEEVLKGSPIEFKSSRVKVGADGNSLDVEGDLLLWGVRRLIDVVLTVAGDDRIEGTARIRQTMFGVEPYTALFGSLKVADELEVTVDATTRSQGDG
jgi:hypothetical protein